MPQCTPTTTIKKRKLKKGLNMKKIQHMIYISDPIETMAFYSEDYLAGKAKKDAGTTLSQKSMVPLFGSSLEGIC
jgi:hypothetical protein